MNLTCWNPITGAAAVSCESKDDVLTVHAPKKQCAVSSPKQIKVH